MDQLTAIKVFCRVVETGGFTRAADALDMPKATASKLVNELEAHLRIRLLNRTTRSVQVTSEGAAYYERISRWLRQLDDIDNAFDHERVKPQGRITVDASAWVANAILIPALPRFYDDYPDIQIDLGVSDRPVHLIRENADCVIRGGHLADQTLVGRSLGASRWVTAASPSYLERYGTPSHPSDLGEGHQLISHQLASGRTTQFRFERDGKEVKVDGVSRLSVNESNAHLAAGLAGLGVLQSFEWKLRPALRSGQLVSILDDWRPSTYPFHVLYPPNRFMNTRLRVFIDWLVTIFGELQDPAL
uniref:Transcriptional regulator, LysR family n=1 Tax=Caulobacter sp. (strain K31) TaxID=366602 RepID=B0T977_CAUSK